MAFTFSHAVVAPYLYRVFAQRLPLMPLVIGSMLPDISRVVFPYPIAHHFSGMFSINLLCGGILCLLWYWLYKPVLFDILQYKPAIPLAKNQYLKFSLLALFALLIGNFSHLLWDSFTHLDDRTWFGHQFLAQKLDIFGVQLAMHQALQYGTSLLVLPWLYWGFRQVIPTINISHLSQFQSFRFAWQHAYIGLFVSGLIGLIISIYYYYFSELSLFSVLVQGFKYFCLLIFAYFNVVCLYHYRDLLIKHTN